MESFCHKKKQGVDLLPSGMRMIIGHLAIMAIMQNKGFIQGNWQKNITNVW